jgi:hypothetical protein
VELRSAVPTARSRTESRLGKMNSAVEHGEAHCE